MFTDHRRGAKMFVSLLLILALGAYYAHVAATMQSGWRWCQEDPVARDGSTLIFPLWTVTAIRGPDSYEISKVIKDIPVRGDTAPLHVGATVSLVGRFDAQAVVVREEVREIHTLRRWKELLSVAGFLLVAAAAPVFFRVGGGRIRERVWPT